MILAKKLIIKILHTCSKLLIVSFLLFINLAYADLDCGSESIGRDVSGNFDPSYTMDKIRSLCGNPTKIKNWNDEAIIKYGDTYSKIITKYSMWTYNRGSNTFIEYLLFKNGFLVDLKDGEYGS